MLRYLPREKNVCVIGIYYVFFIGHIFNFMYCINDYFHHIFVVIYINKKDATRVLSSSCIYCNDFQSFFGKIRFLEIIVPRDYQ